MQHPSNDEQSIGKACAEHAQSMGESMSWLCRQCMPLSQTTGSWTTHWGLAMGPVAEASRLQGILAQGTLARRSCQGSSQGSWAWAFQGSCTQLNWACTTARAQGSLGSF